MSAELPLTAALALALALLLAPSQARAQACCAGASAVTPARLAQHEDALVGGQLRLGSVRGSHDSRGVYRGAPHDSQEQDGGVDLIGAVRALGRLQVALLAPVTFTRRSLAGTSEVGGGLGDLNASARVELTRTGASVTIPGVSLLAGATAPTGRPVESSKKPFATDATGLGTWEATAGLNVEQLFGRLLVGATGLASLRGARQLQGQTSRLAPRFSGLLAVAYTFENDGALALALNHTREGQATLAGAAIEGSDLRSTTVTLAGLLPLSDHLRVQGGLSAGVPLDDLGRNSPVRAGLTFAVFRTWM